ncbi:VOC family protein [Enterovibrio paralichthyis]|uniref:SMU1112c/YaeR family gloxylase I-like metalloprotein n=1 Tax=Enterovibrio paralichthyis TaxID=2853805 RepID=UPI001C4843F1|nr:VOC family protein [Enterovibrio paralichthyis]MBV7296426.1 VOC family protein [Enterovibrio paralichthyis]
MEISGIHHVALIVSDIENAKRFYRDVLGLTIIAENYREERDSWKIDWQLPDGRNLEMFSFPASPERPSYPEARGLRHLAFQTPDIDKAVVHLNRCGVAVEPVRIDPYTQARFTFFSDPDGLPLELYEVR